MMEDGSYDVFVVDVDELDDVDGAQDALRLSLAVTSGPHKGEVVDVTATGLGRGLVDLIGTPATLVVEGGAPSVSLDA